ncbi:MAG TPA: APC family permease [Candidatus Dormibacteraeota bacterium]|nr:APC family permease [Candidatus Dormibacteraeota bacterium]
MVETIPGLSSTPDRRSDRLLKILGVGFGVAVAVGNTIGAGIVRTPGDIASVLPKLGLFFAVWFGGALYALLGAFQLAELGAAIPRSGGQYNFSRRALGEYAGFIVGWSDWLSTCGTLAAVGIVIGEYSGKLFPVLDGHVKVIAVGVILFFAAVQWKSLRFGSGVQNVTSLLKAILFTALVAACFVIPPHTRYASGATPSGVAPQALMVPLGWALFAALVVGLQATIYTYDGWDGVIYFGDEVRDPGTNIPRGITASVISIFAIYLMINAALVYVLPINEIAGNNFALGAAAERVFGAHGGTIFRSVMVLALLSSINALQLMGTRVIYAMSRDGLFFRRVARVNRGGTPALALALSAAIGIVFAVFSFERVIAMLAFFFVANYTISFISLFILRTREPELERPYRAWGYPWTTAAALVGSLAFLAGAIVSDRQNSRLTLIALAISYPMYRLLKWVAARGCSAQPA